MTYLPFIIFWMVVVIFAVTSGLLSYSLIRFQRKSTDPRQFPDNPALGIIWTLVPVGILAVLVVLTYQTII